MVPVRWPSVTLIDSRSTFAGRFDVVVECEVELEDVHARVAEDPEWAACGVLADHAEYVFQWHAACVRYPSSLQRRVAHRDVRVET